MASINYAARQISVKIVYYGPGLSGKTTNLQVIHKKTPLEHRSDMVSLATETDRTLFFDFLPLDLGKIKQFDTKFQLYTVPGQVYYNATRKLVLRGVDGVVFVADSGADKIQENLESFQNLEDNLAEYGYQKDSIPIIIQYNKRDLPNALPIEELQRHINKYNLPYGEGIAYKGVGVFDTLKQIGKIVIDHLNKKYSRTAGRSAPAVAPAPVAPAAPAAAFQQQQFAPPPPPPAPAYQQPMGGFAPPPPPAPSYQPPIAEQPFAPPPPPPAPAYQQPMGGFAPPPPPVPSYQPPISEQAFAPPPVSNFQPMPEFSPPAPAYQPPVSEPVFAPPPPAQSFQPQSFDPFEATPSFEPPAPAAQQQFGGDPFAPPPQQQYQAPPPAVSAYEPQAFEPVAPPAAPQSFEMAAPSSFEIAPPSFEIPAPAPQSFEPPATADPFGLPPAAPQSFDSMASVPSFEPPAPAVSFDPYAQQQQASPWGEQPPAAPNAFDNDPFMAPPAAPAPAANIGSFEVQTPPPAPAQPNTNFDDVFMLDPPPTAAPPPTHGMPPPNNQGGFGNSPFDFEMAPPPMPSVTAYSGQGGNDLGLDAAPQEEKSELDLEIEKYQREIEEKQKQMHSDGGIMGFHQPPQSSGTQEAQPYLSQGDNHQSQFDLQPNTGVAGFGADQSPAPWQSPGVADIGVNQSPAPWQSPEAADNGVNQSPAPWQNTGAADNAGQSLPPWQNAEAVDNTGQSLPPWQGPGVDTAADQSASPWSGGTGTDTFDDFEAELSGTGMFRNDAPEEYPTDSAMFFTSVDRNNRPKKPVKPPVNPAKMKAAQQQQKGFLPKLFNKNQ
jgi:signal recognition particle receptor subunit beta